MNPLQATAISSVMTLRVRIGNESRASAGRTGNNKRISQEYRNKLLARLQKKIDAKKKGLRRRKKLIKSKQKQLRKLAHQIKDIEHKATTRLVSTLQQDGVQTLVIGDVRDIRQGLDVGSKDNQKLHQWSHGSIRHKLTYKAERAGMGVELQEESSTSRTCPACGKWRKSPVQALPTHPLSGAPCLPVHTTLRSRNVPPPAGRFSNEYQDFIPCCFQRSNMG